MGGQFVVSPDSRLPGHRRKSAHGRGKMSTCMSDFQLTQDAFLEILTMQGLAGGLAFLNDGVPHRFTAVYRYAGLILKNVCLHDALGKRRPLFLSALPLNKSLAQFIQPGVPFRTDDSSKDARLLGHAYDGILFSYHGTALVTPAGNLWGTLCHFDFKPLPLSDADFGILESVAPAVAAFAVDPHA